MAEPGQAPKKSLLRQWWRQLARERRLKRLARNFWEWTGEDQQKLDFYRQFIAPGDTVYDVGANLGNRSKVFAKLGATVVAVEPQRMCADFLATVFRDRPGCHLVRCALGASVGEAEMFISDAHTISSLSAEWVSTARQSGRFGDHEWNGREKVPVDTLDNLIGRYGSPSFVKIDVEGFEQEVLRGLSQPAKALSLEFVPEFRARTEACLDHLCSLGDYRFQLSLGESLEFVLPAWGRQEELRRALEASSPEAFGDVYARIEPTR